MRKLLSLLLVCSLLVLSASQTLAFAGEEDGEKEEKYYCNATLDDDFADDCVLVVLFNEQSKKLLTYTPEDFPVDNISEVRDLTELTVKRIKEQRESNIQIDFEEAGDDYINENKFHQILQLMLKEKGKQAVLDAIHELEKVDFIMSAEPNHYDHPTLDDTPEQIKTGDVNHDGFTGMADVVLLQRHIAKLNSLSEEQLKTADVNGDSSVTMADVTMLQQYIAGLVSF